MRDFISSEQLNQTANDTRTKVFEETMAYCDSVANYSTKILITAEEEEENSKENRFTVRDPVLEKDTDGIIKFGMVHKYVVNGVDNEGEF